MPKPRKPLPKPRNPAARALRDPLFRPRLVPSGKAYRRRERSRRTEAGGDT